MFGVAVDTCACTELWREEISYSSFSFGPFPFLFFLSSLTASYNFLSFPPFFKLFLLLFFWVCVCVSSYVCACVFGNFMCVGQ